MGLVLSNLRFGALGFRAVGLRAFFRGWQNSLSAPKKACKLSAAQVSRGCRDHLLRTLDTVSKAPL